MQSIVSAWALAFFDIYAICDRRRSNTQIMIADIEETVIGYAKHPKSMSLESCTTILLEICSGLEEGFVPLCSVAHFDREQFGLRAANEVTKLLEKLEEVSTPVEVVAVTRQNYVEVQEEVTYHSRSIEAAFPLVMVGSRVHLMAYEAETFDRVVIAPFSIEETC